MSLFSTFNPKVGPCLIPSIVRRSHVRSPTAIAMDKPPTLTTTQHQLRAKEHSLDVKETSAAVSRREVMGLAGLSVAIFSLSLPKPAEARITRAEMKNTIMRKLRELREKFGGSKPNDEGEEQTLSPANDSEPQHEHLGEQNMSSQEDERMEAAHKSEGEQGKNSVLHTENKNREVDLEPLA